MGADFDSVVSFFLSWIDSLMTRLFNSNCISTKFRLIDSYDTTTSANCFSSAFQLLIVADCVSTASTVIQLLYFHDFIWFSLTASEQLESSR